MSRAARRPGRSLRPLHIAVAGVLAVLVGAAAVFFVSGGRCFVVRTPSMGTAAPVGTLVLTLPASFGEVRTGDVIAFHPPTEPSATYTHRVVSRTASGLRTQGDINGAADPWTVTSRDLIGRATVVLPGVGWLLRALPYLLIGGLIVWGLTRQFVSAARRGPARQFGGALVFMITAIILRPFVGVAQLASTADATGASRISVVSTGLLPVRLSPADGTGRARAVDLNTAGDTGISIMRGGKPGTQYHLQSELHLTSWQWIVAVLVVLSPVLWTLLVGFRPAPARRGVSHRAVPA